MRASDVGSTDVPFNAIDAKVRKGRKGQPGNEQRVTRRETRNNSKKQQPETTARKQQQETARDYSKKHRRLSFLAL
jgi:hypothetical protein